MTDYRKRYEELLESNRKLNDELEQARKKLAEEAVQINSHQAGRDEFSTSGIEEIFNTVSGYMAMFRINENKEIIITDLNSRAASVESVTRNEVAGMNIAATKLSQRSKLVDLLNTILSKGSAYKITASSANDDSEGHYIGFRLSSDTVLVTWEPGSLQKSRDDLSRQNVIFSNFADLLPEMIYEVDLTGRVLYANNQAIKFFGYQKDELIQGIYISDIFPDSYERMIHNLKELVAPGQISSNEYLARRPDGTSVPIMTHSFAIFHQNRIMGQVHSSVVFSTA